MTYSLTIIYYLPILEEVIVLDVRHMHHWEDIETLLCMFGLTETNSSNLAIWANLWEHNDDDQPNFRRM